jgi:uncharacterized protein (UPF0297 family)
MFFVLLFILSLHYVKPKELEIMTKDEISEVVIDIFDRINIETPNNINKIIDYIVAKGNNTNQAMVEFNFKLWIEHI